MSNFIYSILKKIVHKNPSNIAVQIDTKKYTYKNFFEDSYNISNFIIFNKKNKIGIIGSYSYLSYISVFGSLISGKTYIPINQNLPIIKIKNIIIKSKIDLLIIDNSDKKKFKFFKNCISEVELIKFKEKYEFRKEYRKQKILAKKNAYIIFTSGTTGEPKGVPISRKNFFSYLKWLLNNFKFNKKDSCSQFPNLGFDLSVVDIFSTILSGSKLYVPKNLFFRNYPGLFIKKFSITHAVFVPSFIDLITNASQLKKKYLRSLKKIFFCGEPLYKHQLAKLFKANPNLEVINAYGPTEATVSCTKIKLNSRNYSKYCFETACIGKPIRGTKLFLTNKFIENKEFKEILLGGKQVFNGYLDDPNLNKKKFVKIKNIKYFKTGDLVKKINNQIYFQKRHDTQIKIKGYRVELEEIDTIIRKFGIKDVKTIKYNNCLLTFIMNNKKSNIQKLDNYIRNNLPWYMVPNRIIKLKQFPTNINNKLDINKLKKYVK